MKPNWLELAQAGDLTEEQLQEDAAETRWDTVCSNLQAAMQRVVDVSNRISPELGRYASDRLARALKGE